MRRLEFSDDTGRLDNYKKVYEYRCLINVYIIKSNTSVQQSDLLLITLVKMTTLLFQTSNSRH